MSFWWAPGKALDVDRAEKWLQDLEDIEFE